MRKLRWRRAILIFSLFGMLSLALFQAAFEPESPSTPLPSVSIEAERARDVLESLAVKGRAPKTGYAREQFGSGWATVNGCDTRNIILYRDLSDVVVGDDCIVVSGTLFDPYTGESIDFSRQHAADIQIDHVVALSDAWQKGAQQLDKQTRIRLANDPLELLAVSGKANQEKGDGDVATWLPAAKGFRCEYVARQIAIKRKYELWVTAAEKQVMSDILASCPEQRVPVP